MERDDEAVAVWKAEVWPDIKAPRATWAWLWRLDLAPPGRLDLAPLGGVGGWFVTA